MDAGAAVREQRGQAEARARRAGSAGSVTKSARWKRNRPFGDESGEFESGRTEPTRSIGVPQRREAPARAGKSGARTEGIEGRSEGALGRRAQPAARPLGIVPLGIVPLGIVMEVEAASLGVPVGTGKDAGSGLRAIEDYTRKDLPVG